MENNTFETRNPATAEPLERYDVQSTEEASRLVDRCHAAFQDWRTRTLEERAEVIGRIGEELAAAKEDLAACMTAEMGKLLDHSRSEVDLCVAICRWTAEHGPEELADEERDLQDGGRGLITHRPIGVVYGIQPWNFPAYQVVRYSIANLMAGNGVLLKHAENVLGSAQLLVDVYARAGLPEGLFGLLIIDHDTSDEIIAHEHVRGVTMTGSTDAGRHIAMKAAEGLKKTVMELGSNDAWIVLDDVDMDHAVETCVNGRVFNNGEVCVAAKRFIVVDAIYDTFKERFVQSMQALRVGAPTDEGVDVGPMARADLRDALHEQVRESVEKGAKLLCGGEIPEGAGYYYPPTVLDEVAPGQPAYDDELFGPVASLIRARDAEHAMQLANDSRFGLGGGILCKDEEKAIALARDHFDTGMVFINGFSLADPAMPFGGVKKSGYGREHGGFGVREFVNTKAVVIPSPA
jgi:succinate-semialdehyde dehydrogenase/glutarate-semialdehyde dehydrogenase